MLFNSFEFIFVFLPVVFGVYFLMNKLKWITAAKIWLVISSLTFYGWWNVVYLPLLLTSLLFNYRIGSLLIERKEGRNRKAVLTIGIIFNVSLLGFYKYYDFFISNANELLRTDIPLLHLILPLGISFITFQKIAYLVDAYKREVQEQNILDFSFFVTFFPQLIAGPIVHHKEIMPQFSQLKNKVINFRNIATGLFVFSLGLFKKVAIADTFANWATSGFDHTKSLTFLEAWGVSLSYTFQLYFDFSGYCDMAIGAALLFNIKLPVNFNSPYKALNIQDFWRRWHITLGRFLTQYIYIPLGGSRKGATRTYLNLMIVFLISGLWHGAGWTFLFWGALHGTAMVINRFWQTFNIKMNRFMAWFITFNFVNMAWIFFRAQSWGDAIKVLKGMLGMNGFAVPAVVASYITILADYTGEFFIVSTKELAGISLMIVMFLFVVIAARNSTEIQRTFKPSMFYAIVFILLTAYSLMSLQKVSEFLYFNF
ncbi:MBOAT family protein [Paenibacillus mesophilus]|uniref:MBOAT family O-acyltransferase n=1 Tax=Paenibacillus mesophilus TaxID=2582849 RepID=UPI00110ED501|nr:MBOAT family O-acyltransferase [Paenibacillus mesophilus]TMV47509.1 MBOAT family protein [Paenibacillus mesophilus]